MINIQLLFPSGGFDLDAVGVIHIKTVGLQELSPIHQRVYPNPFSNNIIVDEFWLGAELELYSITGNLIKRISVNSSRIELDNIIKGVYQLKLIKKDQILSTKLIKN